MIRDLRKQASGISADGVRPDGMDSTVVYLAQRPNFKGFLNLEVLDMLNRDNGANMEVRVHPADVVAGCCLPHILRERKPP